MDYFEITQMPAGHPHIKPPAEKGRRIVVWTKDFYLQEGYSRLY